MKNYFTHNTPSAFTQVILTVCWHNEYNSANISKTHLKASHRTSKAWSELQSGHSNLSVKAVSLKYHIWYSYTLWRWPVQYLIVSKAIRYYAQVTVILITNAKHTRSMNVHISRENITIHLFIFTKQKLSTPYVTNMSFLMIFSFAC